MASQGGEAVRCCNDAFTHARIARVVAGRADEDELAARPTLREPPRRNQRRTHVQAPVDQDTGHAGEIARIAFT